MEFFDCRHLRRYDVIEHAERGDDDAADDQSAHIEPLIVLCEVKYQFVRDTTERCQPCRQPCDQHDACQDHTDAGDRDEGALATSMRDED